MIPPLRSRDQFPYVQTIFKETLRWQPMVPLSVPYRPVQEEVVSLIHAQTSHPHDVLPTLKLSVLLPLLTDEKFVPERFGVPT
ncbi:uncharacterized protein EI90DRAFT_2640919 [Cantharellus anzutake]|uniref:uncharacterized protein n=1 Tax=Cantharellus anzutake TaxID=1750568 RepID=UPI0019036221|nr:uncharacterized protein EI90DRAFT_2640919 [Cantharellus anzutake]KAF8337357.1 hypothetical protein EI90DRAFT_2640919 [Cantharellus anzutake]